MILQPCDVLMFRAGPGAPLLGRLIGWAETALRQPGSGQRNYYHVAFVSDDTRLMWSAQPPVIDRYPIVSPLPDYIEVRRPAPALTPAEVANILAYAQTRRGVWYDFIGCLTAGYVEVGGLEFCSKFLNDAFSHAPRVVVPDATLISPDAVGSAPMLQERAA